MSTASADLTKKLMTALTSTVAGNEAATLLNKGAAAALASHIVVGAIVCSHASATTDFGVLAVGDVVVHIPVVAGNAIFSVVVTAGTLATGAGDIGDLYVVLRTIQLPTASAVVFP